MSECNFKSQVEVINLQASILGRLTSGYNETVLCDVLIFFDLHTIFNLPSLDSEVQNKMLQLLVRYFKQKHEMVQELDLEHVVEQRITPKIDLILFYFLDYYGPRYVKTDRKVCITESVMQTMSKIIMECVEKEENFFANLMS